MIACFCCKYCYDYYWTKRKDSNDHKQIKFIATSKNSVCDKIKTHPKWCPIPKMIKEL